MGPAYEHPEAVTDEDIETYLEPFLRDEHRSVNLQRFVAAFDDEHTRIVEPMLRLLRAATLIAWGTDDVYFPVKWAHLACGDNSGAGPPVGIEGARLFFPEERAEHFNKMLRDHWTANA